MNKEKNNKEFNFFEISNFGNDLDNLLFKQLTINSINSIKKKDSHNYEDENKELKPDENKELKPNDEQKKIISHVSKRLKKNVQVALLITGSAGTGKSFVIHKLKNILNEFSIKTILTAHFSLAAQNINGLTAFKLFGYSTIHANILIKESNGKIINHNLKKENGIWHLVLSRPVIYFVDVNKVFNYEPKKNFIIFDEISTVSIDMLDDFNEILKKVFKNEDLFGGVHITCVGDFYQIQPVDGTSLVKIKEGHYLTKFILKELKTNIRQKDTKFFNLCEQVKKGEFSDETLKILSTRLINNLKKVNPSLDVSNLVHIYPKKNLCNSHNEKKLNMLKYPYFDFTAEETFNKNFRFKLTESESTQYFGLLKDLKIALEAKVMITSNFNLSDNYYSNGETAIVKAIIKKNKNSEFTKRCLEFNKTSEALDNKLMFEELIQIAYEEMPKEKNINVKDIQNYIMILWLEKKQYYIFLTPQIKNYEIENIAVYSRIMFPLQLAWASTTHKIQGITLDEGVIDLGEENFDPAMSYVSLTRITDFNNVYISSLSNQKKNTIIDDNERFRNLIIKANIEKKNTKD